MAGNLPRQIDVGNNDAGIIFLFNDQLISVSVFMGSPYMFQDKQSVLEYLINLLTSCSSDVGDGSYQETIASVRDIILGVGYAVFKQATLSSRSASTQARQSVHSLLFPTMLNFRLQDTGTGDAMVVPIDAAEAHIRPSNGAGSINIDELDLDDTGSLLFRRATDKIVVQMFRDWGSSITCRVEIEGQDVFCKAWRERKGSGAFSVWCELESMRVILKETRDTDHPLLRIPQLLGFVCDEEGGLIGFLREWVPGRLLQDVDISGTSIDRRRKWAAQIYATVDYLCDINVLWGDGKPSHVVIDEQDDAWLIDFGGGFTSGWQDEDLAGTHEGDRQAARNIVKFLQVDDDDLFHDSAYDLA
jgi:hypothetical protein